MSGKLLVAATVATGFWRCGRHWTKAGIVVDVAEFTETQWDRLKNEVKLRVSPASNADEAVLEQRAAQIAEGIETLTADDFQKNGKPKLDALNALLADDLGDITAPERDAVWTALQDNGFKAPTASTT